MPSYPGISSEAFRHPLDRQAEQSLRSVPGFDLLASKFIEFFYERPQLIYNMGNCVEVGPRQYATIYRLFRESVRDLDVSPEPTLFVSQNPIANSYSLGKEKPYIVVYSGLLDLMTEEEIRTVLAHELGHIKCGHTVLIQMALWVMNLASAISEITFGLGGIVTSGLIFAFYEWRRKAELSSDRAAFLVTDNLDLVMNSMMKLSGGSNAYGHELSLHEFTRQSEEYRDLDQDSLNQIYKFLLYNGMGSTNLMLTHPFPVDRIHYLREWADSEEYAHIKAGNYKHEDAVGSVNVEPDAPSGYTEAGTRAKRSEAENLRQQIEDLQDQIERLKRDRNE